MDQRSQVTRDHLLGAATRVFAEHGFKTATIRQISELAGANVASVNYHFGDKEALYLEVLKRACEGIVATPASGVSSDGTVSSSARLHALVSKLLRSLLSGSADEESARVRLITREFMDPTPSLGGELAALIEQKTSGLEDILREFLGPHADEQTIRLFGMSILGQVLFHHGSREVVVRLLPGLPTGAAGIEVLSDHITHFAIAALKGLGDETPQHSRLHSAAMLESEQTEVHLL